MLDIKHYIYLNLSFEFLATAKHLKEVNDKSIFRIRTNLPPLNFDFCLRGPSGFFLMIVGGAISSFCDPSESDSPNSKSEGC